MGFLDFLTEGSAPSAVPVSSTEQVVLPDWYTNYAMDILANQRAIANQPFPLYQGPRIAQFAPDQQAGFEATRQGAFSFQPELNTASQQTQGTFDRSAFGAGQPFLAQAGKTAPEVVGQYMNPFVENVVDRIGQLGTRTLKEQILPGLEGEMIRAGQFGGTRQAELTGRAIRDAMEGISAQQSQALSQGFGQAQQAAQTDLSRMGGLASTAGNLYGADTTARLSAAQQMGGLAQQRQQQELAGAAALQGVGAAQQGQTQRNLDLAAQDFERQFGYPQEQVKAMIGALQGVAPAVPKATTMVGEQVPGVMSPSLLSSLGSTFATIKGFENLFG